MRGLVGKAGGLLLTPTVSGDGKARKSGSYHIVVWAESHGNNPANPQLKRAPIPTTWRRRPTARRASSHVEPLPVAPGPFSLRHSQVRMPQQTEPPRAGQSFGLGVLAFDKFGNPMRQGGTVRLQVKQLTGPVPSNLPIQPPPMTCQHIDHLDGMHEVRLTTYRAGEHQLVLTAAGQQGGNGNGGAAQRVQEKENAQIGGTTVEDLKAAAAGGRILRLRVLPADLDAAKCVLKPLGDGMQGGVAGVTLPGGSGPGGTSPAAGGGRSGVAAPPALRRLAPPSLRAPASGRRRCCEAPDSYGNPRPRHHRHRDRAAARAPRGHRRRRGEPRGAYPPPR